MVGNILQSVDKDWVIDNDNSVSLLISCKRNLPDGGLYRLGNIICNAQTADPKSVALHFNKKVMPLLDPNKVKLAIHAIRSLLIDDESICGDTVVDIIGGTTKETVISQTKFTAADFFGGIFLYTARYVENKAGEYSVHRSEYYINYYIDYFRENPEEITLLEPTNENPNKAIDRMRIADPEQAKDIIRGVSNMASLRKLLLEYTDEAHNAEVAEFGIKTMSQNNNAELRKMCIMLIESKRHRERTFDVAITALAYGNQNELYKVIVALLENDKELFDLYYGERNLLRNNTLKARFAGQFLL